MSASTDRQQYRALVAQIADKARAILPQAVNGRVESAVKLVLASDVEPQADGSILVGSSTDPLKQYRLVGATCECQDFVHGKDTEGWCQHRIAAGIHKRAQELLPVAPVDPQVLEPWADNDPEDEAPEPEPTTPAPAPLPEAPASVNVRVTIGGREVQWTLRDSDEARLAGRLASLLARYPVPQAQSQAPAPQPAATPASGWCAVHNVAMQENQKDGRRWFSHRTDEGWCKGRR